mmetsp:Transcript_84528/g.149663  ORF Transcript_84528/g.149663 Transcript_84528/m.149663 type:complete len:546 (-) Transcript_84528:120-1757(-)
MRSPRSPKSPLSPRVQRVSDEAICLQLQMFLDNWHFRVMNTSAGKSMTRNKVVEVALHCLAANGIPMSDVEISKLVLLEESHMIFDVVARMPEGIRERFEAMTLQLQVIITAATRLRQTIEGGDEEVIQELMEESSSTAFGQQTIKRSVIQASKEVAKIMSCKETWGNSMVQRLDRLSHSADIAEASEKKLIEVEAQMEAFKPTQIQKSKKALMGFIGATSDMMKQIVVSNWMNVVHRERGQKKLRAMWEKKIQDATNTLAEYKANQLANVRSVFMRNAEQGVKEFHSLVLNEWHRAAQIEKAATWNASQLQNLEILVSTNSETKAANTKKVMARMLAGQEEALQAACFGAFVQFVEESKKEKEFEEKVKNSEAKMKDYMAKKKEDAKLLLGRMCASTDSGLVQQSFAAWFSYAIEGKKLRELEDQISGSGNKFENLKARQAGSARGVQGRCNEQMNLNQMYRALMAWVTETKINRIEKYYSSKISSKRKQLESVQTLFQSFASDLETGLKDIDGDSSGRGRTSSKNRMARSDGTVSLPNIHGKR